MYLYQHCPFEVFKINRPKLEFHGSLVKAIALNNSGDNSVRRGGRLTKYGRLMPDFVLVSLQYSYFEGKMFSKTKQKCLNTKIP